MRVTFIHVAQEVHLDEQRRICVIGIFDAIAVASPVRPLALPEFALVVGFEGEPGESLTREIALKLYDDDENLVEIVAVLPLRLAPSTRGHPPTSFVAFRFEGGRTFVRDFGDYHFRIEEDGRTLVSTRLSVSEAEPEGGLRDH